MSVNHSDRGWGQLLSWSDTAQQENQTIATRQLRMSVPHCSEISFLVVKLAPRITESRPHCLAIMPADDKQEASSQHVRRKRRTGERCETLSKGPTTITAGSPLIDYDSATAAHSHAHLPQPDMAQEEARRRTQFMTAQHLSRYKHLPLAFSTASSPSKGEKEENEALQVAVITAALNVTVRGAAWQRGRRCGWQ